MSISSSRKTGLFTPTFNIPCNNIHTRHKRRHRGRHSSRHRGRHSSRHKRKAQQQAQRKAQEAEAQRKAAAVTEFRSTCIILPGMAPM